MADPAPKTKILIGIRDLREYLMTIGIQMSPPTIMKYIGEGLPCWFVFNKYHFHTDNIDGFFKSRTARAIPEPPEEIEEGADEADTDGQDDRAIAGN